MVALVGGQVMLSFASIPSSIGFIRNGRLRAIAVSTLKRSPALPDLPTIDEAGVPGYEAESWFGVFAPARTLKEITKLLNAELRKALKRPDVMKTIQNAGLTVHSSTIEEALAFTRADVEKWAKVIKAANMRAN